MNNDLIGELHSNIIKKRSRYLSCFDKHDREDIIQQLYLIILDNIESYTEDNKEEFIGKCYRKLIIYENELRKYNNNKTSLDDRYKGLL